MGTCCFPNFPMNRRGRTHKLLVTLLNRCITYCTVRVSSALYVAKRLHSTCATVTVNLVRFYRYSVERCKPEPVSLCVKIVFLLDLLREIWEIPWNDPVYPLLNCVIVVMEVMGRSTCGLEIVKRGNRKKSTYFRRQVHICWPPRVSLSLFCLPHKRRYWADWDLDFFKKISTYCGPLAHCYGDLGESRKSLIVC